MKKKLTQFRWLVTMLLLVTAMAMPKMAWAEIKPTQPNIGDGTSANPYQIGTAAELYWFAALVNGDTSAPEVSSAKTGACATLTADITVNTGVLNENGTLNNNGSGLETWTPIGFPYEGTFDGQGHTISGLYFNYSEGSLVGLFGDNRGTIKNVGVVDSYFYGCDYVGGVCGSNYNGTITGCYNKGSVSGSNYVGGVCGNNDNGGTITGCYNTGTVSGNGKNVGGVCGVNGGTITRCYNTESVSGDYYVGGVCGSNINGGTITGCYNTGTVSGNGENVGGVCGVNGGTITSCYNTESVSGDNYVGGVCGVNGGTITGCYNTGSVSGNDYVGGVCGNNDNGGTITGCYNTGSVSGNDYVGGVCGNNDNGGTITGCYTNNGGVCGANGGTITDDCGVKTDFTDGTVCPLLNTALKNANASVRFYQGANYPELIMNVPSLVDDVYQISNKEELYAFALLVNKNVETSANAVLTADITVNTGVLKSDGTLNNNVSGFETWTPIGNSGYKGTFDGQGHTISGLYFNDSSKEKVGLFGYVDSGGKISNVGVLDSYFQFSMRGGGICGHNKGEINNCTNGGTVIGNSGSGAGGVCGMNYGTIKDCKNTGSVSGSVNDTGGVCGVIYSGTIENCLNEGAVSGTTNYTGGVCGQAKGGAIKWSYNTASVSGVYGVGGVCGYILSGSLEGCHNTGSVIGTTNSKNFFGGVCGENSGTIKNCYNTGNVSVKNVTSIGGVCGENSGTVTSCFNTGSIGTGSYIGGICGKIGVNSSTTNCYYDSKIYSGNAIGYIPGGTVDNVMGKTTAQFNSGEVCYLLNGSSPYGEWGQKIGTDGYPVPGSAYKVLRAAQDGQEGTNYWATFSNRNSNAELMASTGEITVYNATVSGGTLTLTKRTDNQVAKGEGVLLKVNCEYVNAMNISDEVSAAETGENYLVATPATEETITADAGYKLYRLTYNNVSTKEGLGFYLGIVGESKNGSKLKATPGKAYLKVSTEAATNTANAAPARGFVFPGDDETTGIGEIVIEGDAGISGSANADGRIYNLQGQQVTAPAKGLYIKNNKKVIIK